MKRLLLVFAAMALASPLFSQDRGYDYRLLATNKTSTMERELNEAAEAGFAFAATMGGETAFGGNETVVIVMKSPIPVRRRYKLLATNKTSTMQKEMTAAGNEGFRYCGQTVFNSSFGGREVAVIMELDMDQSAKRYEYKLLATSKTSTMQKELIPAGSEGFALQGLTVARTAFGGSELVSILQREME
ncbi:MAG: hypothetical protein U5J83_01925 [Bryobacterales bacterium]|nr:hypothetical protein [Bryobacterales bacterium]